MNNQKIIKLLITKVKELDQNDNSEYRKAINARIRQSIEQGRPLQLISFTCSTINSKYLFSTTPWKYVSLNPKGNNLQADLLRLEQVVKELQSIYPYIEVVILIGNTDPYYIYLQQFQEFSDSQKALVWKRFIQRWDKYRQKMEVWLKSRLRTSEIKVISWYELEKKIERKNQISFEVEFNKIKKGFRNYFTQEDLEWELRALRKQFGSGKYFDQLQRPPTKMLQDWIIRKFTEYAIQGLWIYEKFPNAILIQNEKPSRLRSKMYQPLIKKKYRNSFPIAYFYGVDNTGYQ